MLSIVCVVYNKKIDDIASLNNFCRLCVENKDVNIIIVDNSINGCADYNTNLYRREFFRDHPYIHLISMMHNIGLSKAYNKAIEICNNDCWIMFSDDDTSFSYEYLQNIYDAIQKETKYTIIAGVVSTNVMTMSPFDDHHIFAKEKYVISKPGYYRNLYCINSGLVVNKTLLNQIGAYDENLFLDMIDYMLMYEFSKLDDVRFLIVSGSITQNFSGIHYSNLDNQLNRFKIFKKDLKYYCEHTKKSFSFRFIILSKRLLNIYLNEIKHRINSNNGGTQ